MESHEYKKYIDGILVGVNALSESVICNVRKSFEKQSKESLLQFEEALKSSKVKEQVEKNIKIIEDLKKQQQNG